MSKQKSSQAGKRSKYRPVNKAMYDKNYDRIFNKRRDVTHDSSTKRKRTNNT